MASSFQKFENPLCITCMNRLSCALYGEIVQRNFCAYSIVFNTIRRSRRSKFDRPNILFLSWRVLNLVLIASASDEPSHSHSLTRALLAYFHGDFSVSTKYFIAAVHASLVMCMHAHNERGEIRAVSINSFVCVTAHFA